jgi:hypothetical protein
MAALAFKANIPTSLNTHENSQARIKTRVYPQPSPTFFEPFVLHLEETLEDSLPIKLLEDPPLNPVVLLQRQALSQTPPSSITSKSAQSLTLLMPLLSHGFLQTPNSLILHC